MPAKHETFFTNRYKAIGIVHDENESQGHPAREATNRIYLIFNCGVDIQE